MSDQPTEQEWTEFSESSNSAAREILGALAEQRAKGEFDFFVSIRSEVEKAIKRERDRCKVAVHQVIDRNIGSFSEYYGGEVFKEMEGQYLSLFDELITEIDKPVKEVTTESEKGPHVIPTPRGLAIGKAISEREKKK